MSKCDQCCGHGVVGLFLANTIEDEGTKFFCACKAGQKLEKEAEINKLLTGEDSEIMSSRFLLWEKTLEIYENDRTKS